MARPDELDARGGRRPALDRGPRSRTAGAWRAGPATASLPGDAGTVDLEIADPVAWGLETPALYRVEARLVDADGGTADLRDGAFGMRDVGTRDGRVTLNGRPVYLLGALDQDYYPDTRSTAPSRAFLDDQFARVRELGLNLLRCHITIPDEAYLDAADEAGLLVWCELPNWNRFSPTAAATGLDDAHGDGRSPGQPSVDRRLDDHQRGLGNGPASGCGPPSLAGRRVRAPPPARPDPADRRQLRVRRARRRELPRPDRPGRLPRVQPRAGPRRSLAGSDRGLRHAAGLAVEPGGRRAGAGRRAADPLGVRVMGAAGPARVHRAGRVRAVVVRDGPAGRAAGGHGGAHPGVRPRPRVRRRRGPRPRDPGAPAGGPALRDRGAATACRRSRATSSRS